MRNETTDCDILLTDLLQYFCGLREIGTPFLVGPSLLHIPLLDDPIISDEMVNAGRRNSSFTSYSSYPVSVEVLKFLTSSPLFLENLVEAFNVIFETARFPTKWLYGTLNPVTKKGKAFRADNCRPIVVEKLAMRILSTVIAQRLELWSSLEDNKGGFCSWRSPWDHIFVLCFVCERVICEQKELLSGFSGLHRCL